jgi:polar amino acid transport system substrate-binding protein
MNYPFYLPFLSGFLAFCAILPAQSQASETFVFCYEKADVRPWRTVAGGGLNIDLLDRVARKIGVTFEYRGMPWKRCLVELKGNRVNGAVGGSFKAERLEVGVYPGGNPPDASKKLNDDRYVLLHRKGSPLQWDGKTFRQLDGAIGIQLGYSVGDQLRNMGVAVDEGAQRASELVAKVVSGRVAGAVLLEGEAKSILDSQPGLDEQLEIFSTPVVEKPYFLILSHALVRTQPQTATRIWDTVEEIRNSPSYRKLERQAIEHFPK